MFMTLIPNHARLKRWESRDVATGRTPESAARATTTVADSVAARARGLPGLPQRWRCCGATSLSTWSPRIRVPSSFPTPRQSQATRRDHCSGKERRGHLDDRSPVRKPLR
jgi:hypothetical protein